MAENILCNIELDEDWIQEDGHWKTDRYIKFTYQVPIGSKDCEFHYRFEDEPFTTKENFLYKDYNRYTFSNIKKKSVPHLGRDIYYAYLYLSSLDGQMKNGVAYPKVENLAKANYITTFVAADGKESHCDFEIALELPPKPIDNISLDQVATDKIVCSWSPAEEAIEYSPVKGYYIAIDRKADGSEKFTPIDNLFLNKDTVGKNYILRVPEVPIDTSCPVKDSEVITFVNTNRNKEVFLLGPENTEFYFNPENLGFEDDSEYRISIYPCSDYFGADLGSDITYKNGVAKNYIYIKTETGWQKGDVWVKTETGWKEAKNIYVKTDNGWKSI